jgi:nucleotide-binding universal stress UspA family protein
LGTPFKKILCGIDGNPASMEAAKQAVMLATKGADLRFTAVYTTFELGPDYHKDALQTSLEEAAKLAGEAGVSASYELDEAKYAIDSLLPESKEHDLMVLGTHGRSRTTGILFGSTATDAAHRSEGPLLIAREAPGSDTFPKRILVASDGLSGSGRAVHIAADIASSFESAVAFLHVADGKHDVDQTVLEEQRAVLAEAIGGEPERIDRDGHAHKEIVEAAKEQGSSLLVEGKGGKQGVKALGSVSERVVGSAPCSVLLIPHRD